MEVGAGIQVSPNMLRLLDRQSTAFLGVELNFPY